MNNLGKQLTQRFDQNAQMLSRLIAGMTEEDLSGFPNERVNNVKWQIGHLTLSRSHFIRRLCPERSEALNLRPEEQALFDRGGRPPKDSNAYPSRERLMTCYHSVHKAWIAYLQSIAADDLDKAFAGKDETLADLLSFLLVHESYHLGQIGFLRSYYGYPGIFD